LRSDGPTTVLLQVGSRLLFPSLRARAVAAQNFSYVAAYYVSCLFDAFVNFKHATSVHRRYGVAMSYKKLNFQ